MSYCFFSACVSSPLFVAALLLLLPLRGHSALPDYDQIIAADVVVGIKPLATFLTPAQFFDTNRVAFNFGNSSGDATIEFIVEGDAVAGGANGFLAVGSSASSSLRFEQFNNSGQVGFTQSGVADYLFSPAVPSPKEPTHLAFVWFSATRTMQLYVNGSLGGSRAGVSASFVMPRGLGSLGNNAANTEGMVGTIQRVTVYDDALASDVLQRHSDAFKGITRPPLLFRFSASPDVLFSPSSTVLSWDITKATQLRLDGSVVTGLTSITVQPDETHVYELIASNAGGSVTGRVSVTVNPGPRISRFTPDRLFVGPGDPVRLKWDTLYAQAWSVSPLPGDVTAQTDGGHGVVDVFPLVDTIYSITASSPFGQARAETSVHVVHPATHLVISEFMANNTATLRDEDGKYSDWIEVYNPLGSPVNLLGYFLTDDRKDLTQWAFPEVIIPARGFALVFASGKNRIQPAAPLHSNFQLSAGGGYLALVGPGPAILHEFDPSYPPQLPDVSYGVLAGDLSTLQFMGDPTPGAPNLSTDPPPQPVQFSRSSGTVTNDFSLSLSCSTEGAEIRYTLNGTTPNSTNGVVYQGPMLIDQSRRVRAIALRGGRHSLVTGESYIRLANDLIGYRSNLPILIIENFGAGAIPQKGWSGDGSGVKQVPRQSAVWATFDRVAGQGTSGITDSPEMMSPMGIRGRGAYSSSWQQKPYSVDTESENGDKRDVSPLGMPAHSEWILYYPDAEESKDPTLLFNTFAYELSRRTGRYSVRFRWVEAFVNDDGGSLKLADRRGVYALIEKVARGKDRLDFDALSADGSTGGWILDLNRMDAEPETGWPAPNGARQPWYFHTAGPDRIAQSVANSSVSGDDLPQQSNGYLNFDTPNGYVISVQQRAAIEGWFKKFEDVFFNNALWRDPTNGYRKYLDTLDFADYFILNTLTHNGDGLLISMFPWKGRTEKLRMGPAWDYNWSPYYVSGSATVDLLWRSDQIWYSRLFTDPDFVQDYIDRWWSLRAGPMSDQGFDDIIDSQVAEISPAKALLNGLPSVAEWNTRLTTFRTWLKTRAAWIDSNYVTPPRFNQSGGAIPNGFQLVIGGTNGVLYYTLDGSDPRLSGGAVSSGAQAFVSPLTLNAQTVVTARLKRGNNWSGLTRYTFFPPQDLSKLAITEIMYNPRNFGAIPGDDLEFVELKNTGNQTLQLGMLQFTSGIQFSFTNGTALAAGDHFVVARNRTAFTNRYPGVAVRGVFTGKLGNNGERIRLSTLSGGDVIDVTYNDRYPWPLTADGYSFSIVPKRGSFAEELSDGSHWRASSLQGGSPGQDDPEPSVAEWGIVINEAMPHPFPGALDQVELYNPASTAVDISGWFLSDDGATPQKYRFPSGSVIPAGGYRVVDERDFNPQPPVPTGFSLGSAGDSVYFTAADASGHFTGYGTGYSFGASELGESWGRYINSVGQNLFVRQKHPTFGAINSDPAVGPVVIQEIHYHPEGDGVPFIELKNISNVEVQCFDLFEPTNHWRLVGFGFEFPTTFSIPAGGIVVVVAGDAQVFRARYEVPSNVPVLGGATGSLQNNGERLDLQRPGWVDGTNGLVYLSVDAVTYHDRYPWPAAPDGGGPSLQRRDAGAFGDDPANWQAALPSPGRELGTGEAPHILTQPESRAIVAYLNTSFTVQASGDAPLLYQWLFNSAPITAATNATLNLPEVAIDSGGDYQVIVFNKLGSVLSDTAHLITIRPASIVQQPISRSTNAGSRVSFSVSALGVGSLRYQWFFKGIALTAATSSTLSLTNVQPIDVGPYVVRVTDDIGASRSDPAVLTVNVKPTLVLSPSSVTAVQGESASLLLRMSGTPPFTVRWRRNQSVVTNQIVNGFESTFEFPSIQPAQAGTYSALVGNVVVSTVTSGNSIVTVLVDADHDGLPDSYEAQTPGLSSLVPGDALLDFDNDGFNNLSEYRAGTNPHDPLSLLKIEEVIPSPAGTTIRFHGVAQHTYTIDFQEALGGKGWLALTNVPSLLTEGRVEVMDSVPQTSSRFYRLKTP